MKASDIIPSNRGRSVSVWISDWNQGLKGHQGSSRITVWDSIVGFQLLVFELLKKESTKLAGFLQISHCNMYILSAYLKTKAYFQ